MQSSTVNSTEAREREKKNVALSSVVAAVFITGLKLVVGLHTNSLGILSEAAHSGLDFIAALITWAAVSMSDRPADREHQFGHGKIESLSALFETFLLVLTCIWIIYEAVDRLHHPDAPGNQINSSIWGFVVVGISIIVDIGRSRALKKAAKKYESQALEADALHFSSDIWSSAVVLLGLLMVQFNHPWVDAVAALFVALLVLIVSYRLGRKTVDALLDIRLPPNEEEWIHTYLRTLSYPVNGFHDFRARLSGSTRYIEFHVEVDPQLTVANAHNEIDKIMLAIEEKYPGSNVIIHIDAFNDARLQTL